MGNGFTMVFCFFFVAVVVPFLLRRQKHRGIERDYWVAVYRKGVATVFAMQIWAANKSSLWVESFSGWSRKSRGQYSATLTSLFEWGWFSTRENNFLGSIYVLLVCEGFETMLLLKFKRWLGFPKGSFNTLKTLKSYISTFGQAQYQITMSSL